MNDLNQLSQVIQETRLQDDPEIQNLLHKANHTQSDFIQEKCTEKIRTQIIGKLEYPFKEQTPNPGLNPESIHLGNSFNKRKPYRIPENLLTKHLLITGATGTGKTTLNNRILSQLSVPFLAFDLKQDFRHLTQQRNDLIVLPIQQFRFNPLNPPPGVQPQTWATTFSEVFGHSFDLLTASKNYLLDKTLSLYQERDPRETPPTTFELHQIIREENISFTKKKDNYRDTVENRFKPLNFLNSQILNVRKGFSIEQLLKHRVVLELDNLPTEHQDFFMEILLAWIYHYRKAQNHRGNQLRHVLLFEEAKRAFSVYKEKQTASGIPPIDELFDKLREFEEGVITADQEPSKLTDSLKTNTETKVCMKLGSAHEIKNIAEALGLSQLQTQWMQTLDTGEAVIQTKSLKPCPVRTLDHPLKKDVSEDQLYRRMEDQWKQLSSQSSRSTWSSTNTEPVNPDTVDVDDNEEKLLAEIAENPYRNSTGHYKQFSSISKGSRAKNKLVEKDLIQAVKVAKHNTSLKLLVPTEKAEKAVPDIDFSENRINTRGSIEHEYWQFKTAEQLEDEGYKVEYEKNDADVHAEKDGEKKAVEIALQGANREIDHVKKHLENGYTTVTVKTRSDKVDKLKSELSENSQAEIQELD